METMRGLGCAVGEYVGDGKAETESGIQEPPADDDLDVVDPDDFGVERLLDEEELALTVHTLFWFSLIARLRVLASTTIISPT